MIKLLTDYTILIDVNHLVYKYLKILLYKDFNVDELKFSKSNNDDEKLTIEELEAVKALEDE